jgi:serine/threonine-protein phosphatase 2A regulatory subunit B
VGHGPYFSPVDISSIAWSYATIRAYHPPLFYDLAAAAMVGHSCVYVYACVCVRACVRACVCICACVHACVCS